MACYKAVLCTFLLALLVLAAGRGQPADPFGGGDPFGGDPFAPVDDPNQQAVDPFGAPDPAKMSPEQRGRWEEKRRKHAQSIVARAAMLEMESLRSSDEQARLQAALKLLHWQHERDGAHPGDAIDTISNLAATPWTTIATGDTPAATVRRLTAERVAPGLRPKRMLGCGFDRRFDKTAFAEYSDAPWPLAWEDNSEHWTQFAEAFFTAVRADDPAAAWRQRIADDEPNAQLYAAAYLGTLHGRTAAEVDKELISLYLRGADDDPSEQFRRVTESLIAVCAADLPHDHLVRQRLRKKYLEMIAAVDNKRLGEAMHLLGDMHRHGDMPSEVRPVIERLLHASSPQMFNRYCSAADLSDATRRRWFLQKQVALPGDGGSAGQVMQQLVRQVSLPVWLDESIVKSDRTNRLRANGPFWEILQAAAAESQWETVVFDSGLIWVGPPSGRAAAEEKLRESRGRIPAGESESAALMRRALRESTAIDFDDIRVDDLMDYLEDLHDLEFASPWRTYNDDDDLLITVVAQGAPLHLALTQIAEQLDGDWAAVESTLVLGPPDFVEGYRAIGAGYRRKMVAIDVRNQDNLFGNDKVAAPLTDVTVLEFYETPAHDCIDYLADLHDVRFLTIDPPGDAGVTIKTSGVPMAWGLTRMLHQVDRDWWPGDELIYIGTPESLRKYAQAEAARRQRRNDYPNALNEALTAEVKMWPGNLRGAAAELTLGGLTIEFDARVETSRDVLWGELSLPADLWLDIVTLDQDLEWSIEEGNKIVLRPTGKMK